MSSAESFRELLDERLTAAAQDIFTAFLQCVAEDKEEIRRLRRLLDVVWKPEIKLKRIEITQHVVREDEVLTDHQLCHKERKSISTKGQEEPQPQVIEEQEEFCSGQEEDEQQQQQQHTLKEETDIVMLTPTDGETDFHEDGMLDVNPDETLEAAQEECAEITYVVGAPDSDLDLPASATSAAGSQDEPREKDANFNSKSQMRQKLDVCPVCGRSFKGKGAFRTHMKTHEGATPFVCQTCGKQFRKLYLLKEHMRIHRYSNRFTCETCGKSYTKNQNLEVHMKTHDACKPYICGICGKSFRSDYWKVHMRTHAGENLNLCENCGKACAGECLLKGDTKTHSNEVPHVCKTCGKCFGTKKSFNSHVRAHTGETRFACKACGTYFTKRKALKNHTRKYHPAEVEGAPADLNALKRSSGAVLENPETPRVIEGRVEICSSLQGEQRVLNEETDEFIPNSAVENLTNPTPDGNPDEILEAPKTAQRSDERPHVCATCGRNYKRIHDLKTHLKTHTAERPFVCKICRKPFRKVYLLHKHMKSHNPNMRHGCKTCGERFSLGSALEAHLRTHNVSKPLVRDTCEKGCSTEQDLRVHRRTHSEENPHACRTGGEQFARGERLKIHVRVHHPSEEEGAEPADMESSNQERSFKRDQENPETLQVKEEQREVTSGEGVQLVSKEVMATRIKEESGEGEGPTLDLHRDGRNEESEVKRPATSSVIGERQPPLNNSHVAPPTQAQKGRRENPGSSGDTESKSRSKSGNKEEHKQRNVKEGEMDPRRRWPGVAWKPTIRLQQIELPQQQVYQEEGLADRRLCHRESKPAIGQQEALCTPQVYLKEADISMATPTYSQGQTVDLNPRDTPGAAQEASAGSSQYESTKPHVCKECGESFTLPSYLEIHMRIHKDEVPYKRGKHLAMARVHARAHRERKQYICKECGKLLQTSYSLRNHMRIHTGEKPYVCETCGKRHRQKSGLRYHMIREHGGQPPHKNTSD